MIQRSEISHKLVAILIFRGNVTMLLPFGASYPQDKSAPDARMQKKRQRKDARSAHLPVVANFWPTKHTNLVPALLAKAGKPIQLSRLGSATPATTNYLSPAFADSPILGLKGLGLGAGVGHASWQLLRTRPW
jgi:hypothetical protein